MAGATSSSGAALILALVVACGPRPASENGLANHRGPRRFETPIYLAIATDSGLVLEKVDATGLHEVLRDTDGGGALGWLDPHTLVSLENGNERGSCLHRFVDGRRITDVCISEDEIGAVSPQLALTDRGEAWLTTCNEWTAEGDCGRQTALRALPTKSRPQSTRPPGIDPHRAGYVDDQPWQRPPTTVAPSGIAIELQAAEPPGDEPVRRRHASCRQGTQTVIYPDEDTDWWRYGFESVRVRWVITNPPVYELEANWWSPVENESHEVLYFRACEDKPMLAFAWLGDNVWAEYVETDRRPAAGMWHFYDADKELGTVEGDRTLRVAPSR